MSDHPRLPDFIGIGAMRAGTSWLRKQLAHHPQLWMADPKELHFFDRHFEDDPRAYARHFAGAPAGARRGEITPAYAILPPERIAIARAWMPEVKLLFMMRDPVERLWSHARKDFPQFRGRPAGEASAAELLEFARLPQVAARGDYLGCLRAWRRAFPPERIWCGFLEEAAHDPAAVLREVFVFLGVDPEAGIDREAASRRENARPEEPMPPELRAAMAGELYRQNEALSELIGRPLPWQGGQLL